MAPKAPPPDIITPGPASPSSLQARIDHLTQLILHSRHQSANQRFSKKMGSALMTSRNFSEPADNSLLSEEQVELYDAQSRRIAELQTQLISKSRHALRLEQQLIQCRKLSTIKPGLHLEDMLQERDQQIMELRANLEDKDRMLQAFMTAKKKREMIEFRGAEKVFAPHEMNKIRPLKIVKRVESLSQEAKENAEHTRI